MEKSGYTLTNKTKSVPTIQKPGLTCQNPQFSDVIAIEGFQQPLLHLFDLKPMPKKGTRKSPLNCRLKSRLNRLYFKNNHFKRYFLSAWTPLPLEPENCIRKKAIGARIGLILLSRSFEGRIQDREDTSHLFAYPFQVSFRPDTDTGQDKTPVFPVYR